MRQSVASESVPAQWIAVSTLLLSMLASPLSPAQQPAWAPVSPTNPPPGMHSHVMVFDLLRVNCVMFGSGLNTPSGTWTWDGQDWTAVNTTQQPRGIQGPSMVADTGRLRAVLFGGLGGIHFDETWEYDGLQRSWTLINAPVRPAPRRYAGMAFDSGRQRTVLFGGGDSSQLFNDTWEYFGFTGTWSKINTATSPPNRFFFGMAYDQARQRVVLFGGGDHANYFGDTWEYDGKDWTQRSPSQAPSQRWGHTMVYDPARETIVLFGGRLGNTYYNDVWEWDGEEWLPIQPGGPSPSPRQAHAMAYDLVRAQMVVYGGHQFPAIELSETWIYRSGRISARFSPLGSGCGPVPVARLALATGSRPLIGTSMTLIANALPATTGLMAIGTQPLPAPIPLDPLGFRGCSLYQSVNVLLPFPVQNGTGQLTVPIPNLPAAVGLRAYVQAAAGQVVTNAGELRIGDQ